jgi:methionine sulfoxide reductase heme-binding subunit
VLHQLAVDSSDAAHDGGVLELSVLSARFAYAMMCLSLTWGVLTSLGWVNRFTGRQALRSGHMILASFTLAFAGVHGLSFLLLNASTLSFADLYVPFATDVKLYITFGTLAFEGLLAATLAVGLRRFMSYWRWLWLHRLAYPAFGLGVLHAFWSSMNSGTFAGLWLIGLTFLIPAVTVTVVRLIPARALASTGLIEDGP